MSLYPMTLKKYCDEIEGCSALAKRTGFSRQTIHKRIVMGWEVNQMGKCKYLYPPNKLFKI